MDLLPFPIAEQVNSSFAFGDKSGAGRAGWGLYWWSHDGPVIAVAPIVAAPPLASPHCPCHLV
jgi:hypothetical protein